MSADSDWCNASDPVRKGALRSPHSSALVIITRQGEVCEYVHRSLSAKVIRVRVLASVLREEKNRNYGNGAYRNQKH